jgi:hypothetical protein
MINKKIKVKKKTLINSRVKLEKKKEKRKRRSKHFTK